MRRTNWLLCCLLLGLVQTGLAQPLIWRTWEELPDLQRGKAKPILIYVYADWCKYCVMQEQLVFQDSLLAASLNQGFYCLKLNSDEKESLSFLGRSYHFRPSGPGSGEHELATFFGKKEGNMSFPTLVFLSKKFQPLGRKQGFVSKERLFLWMEKCTENYVGQSE